MTEPDLESPGNSHTHSLSKKIKWSLPNGVLNVDTVYNIKLPSDSGVVSPMAFQYGTRVLKYDSWVDEYRSMPGKFIGAGIGTNLITYATLYKTYGFTKCVAAPNAWGDRIKEGFKADSILVSLDDCKYYSSIQTDIFIDSVYKKCSGVNTFFIDEPFEKDWTWGHLGYLISSLKKYFPNSILCFAEYRDYPQDLFGLDGGHLIDDDLLINGYWPGHIFIMQDEYKGNVLGPTAWYWNNTSQNFGTSVYGDWMNSFYNTGAWWSTLLNNYNNSYRDLFGTANDLGLNKVFLWVDAHEDNSTIVPHMVDFSNSAWEKGWLKRHLVHYQVYQQCDNPNDPEEDQYWYTVTVTSTGIGYYGYSE